MDPQTVSTARGAWRPALAALALAAVACLPPTAHWPYRGDFVCSQNATAERREVVAEDGLRRRLPVRELRPGERKCYRWPFVDYDGRVGLATARDTLWGEWFRPWRGVRGGDVARRKE